jgi:hypothetical protein
MVKKKTKTVQKAVWWGNKKSVPFQHPASIKHSEGWKNGFGEN